jgi:hypothetical protein
MNPGEELQKAIDDSRAMLRSGFPGWLRPFVLRDVAAITIGRRVYVSASVAQDGLERLLRHEIEHVRQISRLGFARFYVRYGFEYVRNRLAGMKSYEAYRSISFEREAFAAEEQHRNLDV